MKNVLLFIFIALAIPSFGQTKADFLNCLDLVFSHNEFQPAFTNDPATSGTLIILSGETDIRQGRVPAIIQIQQLLTQDDFHYFDHNVQVVRQQDLETLGISANALLTIVARGSESKITLMLISNIKYENQAYLWSYNLVKEGEEWEITAHSLSKQKTTITDW